MKGSRPSCDQPWKTCFGIGWRDSNGLLKIMVIPIQKLNVGWFAFLGFLSESEMLHLGGTPYKLSVCLEAGTLPGSSLTISSRLLDRGIQVPRGSPIGGNMKQKYTDETSTFQHRWCHTGEACTAISITCSRLCFTLPQSNRKIIWLSWSYLFCEWPKSMNW
jgi:hypothetical protein